MPIRQPKHHAWTLLKEIETAFLRPALPCTPRFFAVICLKEKRWLDAAQMLPSDAGGNEEMRAKILESCLIKLFGQSNDDAVTMAKGFILEKKTSS